MQCVHQKFLFTILFSDKKKTQVFIDEKVGVNAVLNVPPITAQMFFLHILYFATGRCRGAYLGGVPIQV